MKFLPLKKKTKECFLALDIGTEAVKAIVFEKESDRYFILGSAMQYFDELRPFDNDKIILNVKEEAMNMACKNPRELLISFPPNILKSRVRTLNATRQKPEEIITKEEAKSITESAFKKIEKEIIRYFTEYSGILPQDIKFIDEIVLEVKIDGYQVPDILGYNGKDLEFKILTSFLPKGYFENFNKIFNNPHLKIKIVNPVKNLNVLGLTEGVFIDIGGDVTQLCLIRNGKIEFIDEFDLGGKDFSRVIYQTLGMQFQEARFFKEKYSRGDLTEETRGRTKEILSASLRAWHSNLKSKLRSIKGLLPSTFYIFGGGSKLSEIEEVITNEEKEVKYITFKDFKNIVDNTNCLTSPQFTNLILILYG